MSFDREIDPAVFDVHPKRQVGRPRVHEDPAPRQKILATEAIARVGELYHTRYGSSPFSVVTIIAAAGSDPDLLEVLNSVAPDRFGMGSISRNMLTRWFSAQEVVPGPRFRLERVAGSTPCWRYVPI